MLWLQCQVCRGVINAIAKKVLQRSVNQPVERALAVATLLYEIAVAEEPKLVTCHRRGGSNHRRKVAYTQFERVVRRSAQRQDDQEPRLV